MKILSFGEIIWDVYENEKFIGGAPLNLAAHCSKQGADSFMLSSVGNDDLGKNALEIVKSFNVKTDFVSINKEKETGKCIVTLNENGVPSYNVLTDVAYDYIKEPDNIKIFEFDVFCFGTLALRSKENLETVKSIIKNGNIKKIYCDINIRPPFFSDNVILFALENSNILKISDEEMHFVTEACALKELEDIAEKYKNLEFILLTQGEKGATVYDCKNKKAYTENAPKVEVKSTVGAGDSFGATFICEYFKTNDIKKSLKKATEISAFVVSKKEAIPEY
jgi:fructokinase